MHADHPYAIHDQMVIFLDSLAVLMGCHETAGLTLPDGRRPDVLRFNKKRRMLFIGDAKHTERPGSLTTLARLHAYFKWISAHADEGGMAVFALCVSRETDIEAWGSSLEMLAKENSLDGPKCNVSRFPPDLVVLWVTWGTD